MLNQVYRLVSERKFESTVISENIAEDSIIVRPTFLSICHADQRYYTFKRNRDILATKLPMALIHEGIGDIVYSKNSEFVIGDRVAMVPTIATEADKSISVNYLQSSKFRSSSYDGLMQELVVTNSRNIVKITDKINSQVGSFKEII